LEKNADNLREVNAEVRQQVERGVFDIEVVKRANDQLIATIEDSVADRRRGQGQAPRRRGAAGRGRGEAQGQPAGGVIPCHRHRQAAARGLSEPGATPVIMERLFGEFVDVIEWTDPSSDTLVWRFERYNNEIKFGAKLTVREGQTAVFVNEGEIADVFTPGMYELRTANLPILSTLQGWSHGFQSPFKAEVYFFSMRRFPDLKWGTRNPAILRDAEFGPVRLRAFGTYEIRIADPPCCSAN
jgi:hypothetical protein